MTIDKLDKAYKLYDKMCSYDKIVQQLKSVEAEWRLSLNSEHESKKGCFSIPIPDKLRLDITNMIITYYANQFSECQQKFDSM